ncbi:hypothetical protein D3C76_728570 [compost metagenome]
MLQLRLSNYTQVEPIIGVHVSYEWAALEVLKLTQEEVDEQRKKILEEQKDPIYQLAAQRSAQQNGAMEPDPSFNDPEFGGGQPTPTPQPNPQPNL